MFNIIRKSLKTGVLTEADPFGTQASFGFPVIDFGRCTGCEDCARACPTGAIAAAAPAPGRKTLTLSLGACIQCRACVTACGQEAVSVSTGVEVAAYTRDQLAHFKCPHSFTFVTELPKTATGKIQKFVLRGRRAGISAQ